MHCAVVDELEGYIGKLYVTWRGVGGGGTREDFAQVLFCGGECFEDVGVVV